MKKTLLILSMLFGIATISFAQDGGGRRGESRTPAKAEDRAKKTADNLQTKLKLSDDQKAKVYSISLEQAKKVDSLRSAPGEMKDKFPKMKTIREASDAKINTVLNDEQKKAYKTLQEERRKNWGPKEKSNK